MSLAEARGVLETMVATERLNLLDDLLTTALESPQVLGDDDRNTARAIGREMLTLLQQLRIEVGPIRELVEADGDAFDERTEQFVASTGALPTGIVDSFRAAGWHVVAANSLRMIEESWPIEEELTRQIGEISGGMATAGDFPRLFKCSLYFGFVAMGVTSSLLAGPIGMASVLGAISAAGLGVWGLPATCRDLLLGAGSGPAASAT